MLDPKNDGQTAVFRFSTLRESRCALALLALFTLATVSVLAATSALSLEHASRIATDLRR
ncbi:MAG TPA: hypothetical protein VGU24_02335 [Microvirga sp.]|jgi:hypothetical protein|nr:hypothetical protein [Microvirga sp.]